MINYREDERQWEGNSEEDDLEEERRKKARREFNIKQKEVKEKIKQHINASDANINLINPEFLS